MMTRSTKVKTTEQALSVAMSKTAGDIANLSMQKENAVRTFRQTANDLKTINEGLSASLDNFAKLQQFISEKVSEAEQMIADNNKVCEKIFDIIGE